MPELFNRAALLEEERLTAGNRALTSLTAALAAHCSGGAVPLSREICPLSRARAHARA